MTVAAPLTVSAAPLDLHVDRAAPADVPALAHLLAHWSAAGETLPRTADDIALHLADFVVARHGTTVLGCGAIHPYHAALAEFRSVGVDPAAHGGGIGSRIVEALLVEAAHREIARVFVLTRAPAFFARHGFIEIALETLPEKVFKDCAACPKRTCCDEIAMVRAPGAAA